MEAVVDRGDSRRGLLLRAAKAAIEATDIDQFAVTTLDTLRCALDASIALLVRVEPGDAFKFWAPPSTPELVGFERDYARIAKCDPCHAAKVRHNPEVAVITEMVEKSLVRRSEAGEILVQCEAEQLLVVRLSSTPHGREGAFGLVIGRPGHGREFDRDTLADIGAVRPILQAAVERNTRAQVTDAIARMLPGGMVVLHRDGRLAWMCREAERLLGGAVPAELRDAARRIAAQCKAAEPGRPVPLVMPIGGASVLEARMYASSADNGPPMVVVRLVEIQCASWEARLPRRLRRVLDLLKTGASEKEVADRAGLSYASAHQYVVEIYRRAEVSSRAQLMAQLANARD
jgi:DNA-binding CsgD family transcriptional regulator